jgi:ribonucleoside-diphosphate reductase alpha chain
MISTKEAAATATTPANDHAENLHEAAIRQPIIPVLASSEALGHTKKAVVEEEAASFKRHKTPAILSALRIRSNTPFGHLHLTISVDPKTERELEVFAQLGKAGDIAASDLEAICRMVSLFLRSGGSIKDVMEQLEGIGSSLSIPTKDGRIMSLGDALGKTIRTYWTVKKHGGLQAILLGDVDFDNLMLNGDDNGKDDAYKVHSALEMSNDIGIIPARLAQITPKSAKDEMNSNYKLKCPECGSGTLTFMEGCMKCCNPECGHSAC